MPDWTYYRVTGTSTGSYFYVTIPYFIQEEWEKEQKLRIKEREKAEQLREDKTKYPLFFLKEGIV